MRMYEMEQVLPGADPEDFDSDPILEANELGLQVGRKALQAKYDRKSVPTAYPEGKDSHAHVAEYG